MGEIINTRTAIEAQPNGNTGTLLNVTQSLLADTRMDLNSRGVLIVPIAELSKLGTGVSSLIPALTTVTPWCWSLFAHPCVEYCYADNEHRSGWTLYDSQRWCR